jgi:hypothetical protein
MALPEDFSKIYGSTATGGLTPISDVNYAKGWEFVGSNPPTKNDFSYLQNLSDLKSQWLYSVYYFFRHTGGNMEKRFCDKYGKWSACDGLVCKTNKHHGDD